MPLPRHSRPLTATLAGCALLGLLLPIAAVGAAATELLTVPVDTVVRGSEGDVIEVASIDVPADLVGQTCDVVGQTENQQSVHVGNDLLIVGSVTTLEISNFEDEGFATHQAGELASLPDVITVFVRLGPDGVSSGGYRLSVDCAPDTEATGETTTTVPPTTLTTTGEPTTTTTAAPDVSPTTAATTETTTTTTETTATTVAASSTTAAPSTTAASSTTSSSTTAAPSTSSAPSTTGAPDTTTTSATAVTSDVESTGETTTSTSDELARSGATVSVLLASGALAIVTGSAMVSSQRRRRA